MLTPITELDVLKSASDASSIADTAIDEQDEKVAAYIINTMANTGAHRLLYNHRMSDTLKATLTGKGYTVKPNVRAACPDEQSIIEFEG